MPLGHRHLGGHQRRGAVVSVVQDFEQILGLGPGQRIPEPVIEDQQLDTSKAVKELSIRAIGVGQGDVVQEAGGALVADMEVVATARVGKSTGQESLDPSM